MPVLCVVWCVAQRGVALALAWWRRKRKGWNEHNSNLKWYQWYPEGYHVKDTGTDYLVLVLELGI